MASAILVETFEVSEQTTDAVDQFDNEALELIERLGLKGQKSLVLNRESEDGGTVTVRNPYRQMTAEEQRVYGTLCPEKTRLVDYKSSAIPLRVLQVAAHSVEFFQKVEVWHPKERVDDDPVLVGVNKGAQSWIENPFILARWGTELLPMDELRALAATTLRERWETACKSTIAEAESFLAQLDRNVATHLRGDYVSEPRLA